MRKHVFLLLFALCSHFAFSQINSNSPTVPFGSRTSYSYGIMPTNLPTGGTYGKSQAAADAYNAWKINMTETCANGIRVKYDTQSETVSEGIAYGMLLAAYAADKATFDGLWKFYKANMNGNGVMNWKINGCSGVLGANGATDAELDAALALIIASEQWPTATNPYTYKNEATTLISKIRQFEIHPTSYQTINGDGWGFSDNSRNPSYQAPAYYREYAKVETTYASTWNSAITAANSLLTANRNATTGLVGNWCNTSGVSQAGNTPNEFGFDAIRNPWRMATDYLWNGPSTAATADDICGKIAYWARNDAGNLKGPCAQNAASPAAGLYKNGTFSMLACAFMGTSGSTYQTQLNTAYTNTVALGNNETYFNQTIRCVTLFMMTGNFWKPGTVVAANPLLTGATTNIDGSKITLTFNKTMATPAAGTYSAFTLRVNGSTVANAFSAIALNGTSAIDLTLSSAISLGDVITISYTPGTIQSADANALQAFTNQSVTNAIPGGNTLIADCEDANETKLLTYWYSYSDADAGGSSTVTPLSTPTSPFTMSLGGANGTDSAAKITYSLMGEVQLGYSPFVGFGFAMNDPEAAYDLSGSTGISFYHKGDALALEVGLSTNTDSDFYTAQISSHVNWTLVTIPWTSFAQNNWGTSIAWDASKIVKFQWKKQAADGTSGTIWIDEVQIDGKVLNLPNQTVVDKDALDAEIISATALHNAAIEGTANGQYPVGSKATLMTAINAATTVNLDADATQTEVDAALLDLQTAVATFEASVISITVDKTLLASSISTAQTVHNGATEGTAVGNYPVGSKTTLLNAITTAQGVYNNASATQIQVNNAKTTLDAAVATFQASVITSVGGNTLIAECDNGNETKLLTYWYSYQSGASSITPLSTASVPFTMTVGGANATDSAAVASGQLVNTGAPQYESCGIGFAFTGTDPTLDANNMVTNEASVIYDLTGATGISFYHKGESVNFSVICSNTKQDAGHDFNFLVPSHTDWTLVEVDFTSLAQESWVDPKATWDPSKIMKLQWQVKGGIARAYTFGIDEVTVLGKVLNLPNQTVVDKDALTAKISEANTTLSVNNFKIKANPGIGEYPLSAGMALQNAIAAATAVKDNAAATQIEADNATTTLNTAIQTFLASIVTSVAVDKTLLASSISTAQTVHNGATEGTAVGNYPVGSKATLLAAINAATTVNTNAAATQTEVDNAKAALDAAIVTFQNSRITSIVVDKSSLTQAISYATGIHNSSVEGTGNGEYPTGSKATLMTAITTAQAVNNNTSATQQQVNDAVTSLNSAVTIFLNSVNGINISTLEDKIDEATLTLLLATNNTGNDPGNYPFSSVTALNTAITTAQNVLATATTQSQITNAVNALQNEINSFLNSAIPYPIDVTVLQTLIDIAEETIESAQIGSQIGQYPANTFNALYEELITANSLMISPNATQVDIDAQVVTLQNIYNEFIASVRTDVEEVSDVYEMNVSNQTVSITSSETIQQVVLTTVLGSRTAIVCNSYHVQISTATIAQGVYFVTIEFANGTSETIRLIKK